jgi:hypothetical protein
MASYFIASWVKKLTSAVFGLILFYEHLPQKVWTFVVRIRIYTTQGTAFYSAVLRIRGIFGTDPGPGIRISAERIQFRIRLSIPLFSSVTFKEATKIK